jgi:DNA-binding CsgD family transcriptional regulator
VGDQIVGRDAELAAVERFLAALSDEPAALVVEGEAGIGKTTVWLEAIRLAEARGLRVLRARPTESEARLSFATLADLVGDVFEDRRGSLPPVQERALAAALLRGEPNEGADPRTIATGFVGMLAALAERGPVLVAVDDVQWLDPASEGALAFASRRLPPRLGLLLTRRTVGGEDLPLGLGRALPESRVERVVPGPLSLAELYHLVDGRLGASLPRPLLARVSDASGGNPFFALEIARTLDAAAADTSVGGPLPLPPSLEELAAGRVRQLSDPTQRVVLAAAALSQPSVASLVEACAPESDARAALVEAEEAGVLLSERERVRFTHPLIASAVYGSASPERRRQLHERLAAVVSDTEQRARHLALSATEPDEEISAVLERAAHQAAARGAQRAAAELFEAAGRLTPPGLREELDRRLFSEAAALLAAGDVGRARALAERAAGSPASDLRAAALVLLGEILWVAGSWEGATASLEQALAAEPADQALVARAHQRLVYYTVAHHPARGIERADAALAALDPERAPGAVASISADRFWAGLLRAERPRPELLERWRELEARAGPDAPKSTIPLIHFHSVDDFEAARARHAVEDEWYRLRGQDDWRAERQAHRSFAEFRAGNWDEAERLVEASCDAIGQPGPGPWAMAFRFRSLVDAGRGRTERARQTLRPMVERAEDAGRRWWGALLLSALAFVEFAAGDHRAVDETLTRMCAHLDALGTLDMVPDRSEPFHVESLLALGEPERARAVLERLEERGKVFPRLWITATLPRTRALLLADEGKVDAALSELDALDLDAAAKLPLDLGWTLLVRGRLERRARRRRAAADSFAEALAIFERLGAPGWAEQARVELDRVGLRRARAELTATERRVAELAAAGLTNREVAARAFMSPKTVEANLARVYRKLGIRSRAELGARIAPADSTPDEHPPAELQT